MQISDRGMKLIMKYEGLRLDAYRDPGDPTGPWTIGYGHTGPDVKPRTKWTKEKAAAILAWDLDHVARFLRKSLANATTTQNQFDALASFTYNLGSGAFHASTLRRRHVEGATKEAANEFNRWVYNQKRVMPGLVKRRAAERKLYLSEQ